MRVRLRVTDLRTALAPRLIGKQRPAICKPIVRLTETAIVAAGGQGHTRRRGEYRTALAIDGLVRNPFGR